MKFDDKSLEVVVKVKPCGDFSIESNTRENIRVYRVLLLAAKRMQALLNRRDPAVILPSNHKDFYTLTK